jgi:hypothetical protein
MATAKQIITRGFKAVMSKGDDVRLDPDEVAVVMHAAETGQNVRVKQGLINPSYLVSIVEDRERRIAFIEDTRHDDKRRGLGMEPLKNLLEARPDKPALGPGQ